MKVGFYEVCMVGYCGACVIGYYGIWVVRACPNFIRMCDTFLQSLVITDNDDVSTESIVIFI